MARSCGSRSCPCRRPHSRRGDGRCSSAGHDASRPGHPHSLPRAGGGINIGTYPLLSALSSFVGRSSGQSVHVCTPPLLRVGQPLSPRKGDWGEGRPAENRHLPPLPRRERAGARVHAHPMRPAPSVKSSRPREGENMRLAPFPVRHGSVTASRLRCARMRGGMRPARRTTDPGRTNGARSFAGLANSRSSHRYCPSCIRSAPHHTEGADREKRVPFGTLVKPHSSGAVLSVFV